MAFKSYMLDDEVIEKYIDRSKFVFTPRGAVADPDSPPGFRMVRTIGMDVEEVLKRLENGRRQPPTGKFRRGNRE